MSLVNEQPANGHELSNLVPFSPIEIPQLGPANPVESTQPISPLAGPDTNTEQPKQRPVTPPPAAVSTPAPPAPRTEEPPLPAKPPQPEFPLRRMQSLGLVMAVAMSAVGQIMFWRGFFGGGADALLGAIAIAAAFEVLMIGATDMSLHHKAEGSSWWLLLFPIGASAAGVAAIVQLLHWDLEMGIPFAAASTLGWAAHAVSGWMRAQHYRTAIAEYNAEVARRRRKAESRADAEYERALADVETTRQAVQRAVDTVTPEPEPEKPAAPAKPNSGRKNGTATGTPATSRPDPSDADIAACWREHGQPGAGTLRKRLAEQGWNPGGESTLRRKIADFRQHEDNNQGGDQ